MNEETTGAREGFVRVGQRAHVDVRLPRATEPDIYCGRVIDMDIRDGHIAVSVADNTGMARAFPLEQCMPCDCADETTHRDEPL